MTRSAKASEAEGTLGARSLSTLVVNTLNRQVSGSLELFHEGQLVATLVFVRGLPVKARTAVCFFLVPLLAELEILHESELPVLLPRLLAGSELHGRVLVKKGFVTPEEVETGLREQLARQLDWMGELGPETVYRFTTGEDRLVGYGGDLVAPFDPLPFVWASVRAQTPASHARSRIARFGDATFHLLAEADPTRFGFDEAAWSVVQVLRQWSCRADEIAGLAAVTEDFAMLVLHTLLLARQVAAVPVEPAFDAASHAPRKSSVAAMKRVEVTPSLAPPTVREAAPSSRRGSSVGATPAPHEASASTPSAAAPRLPLPKRASSRRMQAVVAPEAPKPAAMATPGAKPPLLQRKPAPRPDAPLAAAASPARAPAQAGPASPQRPVTISAKEDAAAPVPRPRRASVRMERVTIDDPPDPPNAASIHARASQDASVAPASPVKPMPPTLPRRHSARLAAVRAKYTKQD